MKLKTLLLTLFLLVNNTYASQKFEPYSDKDCYEIHKAIGTFLFLADREWKSKNADKGLLYSTAAANYSTVFNTVCDSEND
ncbi:MAG: hypothetical protein VCA13_05970 [PS1 clade bacterium]|jgi:hypothetical protein|tara:strand:- start:60 stop:302 length:243 start_codon:yes stop_codon:yes gene_type:complete